MVATTSSQFLDLGVSSMRGSQKKAVRHLKELTAQDSEDSETQNR